MCRWIAYHGDPIFLDEVILAPANSLIEQSLNCREGATSTNGDGFGVGWYGQHADPGLYREVLPAWNDRNLRHLARQIQSPLFFAHVRASTGTETARFNCHPFAHGRWLFMHNGQIGGYARCRRRLEALLGDRLYQHRKGSTDSELMFLLMVQNGLDVDPMRAVRETIVQISEAAQSCAVREPFNLTICLADGNRLFACRHANAEDAPTLYWRHGQTGVLIASEPFGDMTSQWHSVEPDSILVVDGNTTVHPLFAATAPGSEHDIRMPIHLADTG